MQLCECAQCKEAIGVLKAAHTNRLWSGSEGATLLVHNGKTSEAQSVEFPRSLIPLARLLHHFGPITQREPVDIRYLPPLTGEEFSDASFRAVDLAWAVVTDIFDRAREAHGINVADVAGRTQLPLMVVDDALATPFGMTLTSLGELAEALDCDLDITLTPRIR